MLRITVNTIVRSMKSFDETVKTLHLTPWLRSEKKARMTRGTIGTKTMLGCKKAKMRAIMQKRN